jgi:predicted PurR-regulated permease PerM
MNQNKIIQNKIGFTHEEVLRHVYKIEISPKTIVISIGLLLATWFIIKLKILILLIFVAFSISSMLSPIIEYLYKRKIPKVISIALIYIIFLGIILLLILLIYQPLITQIEQFVTSLPDLVVNTGNIIIERIPVLQDKFNWEEIFKNLKGTALANLPIANLSNYVISGISTAFGVLGSFFNIGIKFLTVIILSIYFIQIKEPSKKRIINLLPGKYQDSIFALINRVEEQLGAWLRGQLLLMFITGLLSWLGLQIVGITFAVPLGVMAGILEAVPGLGAMITLVISIIVAAGSGIAIWKIIFIIIWFTLIHQVESYFIIPKLFEKIAGINPIVTIIAIIGASEIFGLAGALLAVPTVAILQISLKSYLNYKNNNGDKEK